MGRGSKWLLRDLFEEKARGSVIIGAGAEQTVLVEEHPDALGHAIYAYSIRAVSTMGLVVLWQGSMHVPGIGDTANKSHIESAIGALQGVDGDGNAITQVYLGISNHTGDSHTINYVVYRILGLGPVFV